MRFLPKGQLLSYEEMLRITDIFSSLGVDKIRVTGGEPFVRKNLIHFLEKLSGNPLLNKISITTNGILTKTHLPQLKALGIHQINLSLDSIDEQNFKKITRRDVFSTVMDTFYQMLADGFQVKINAVIMEGINDHEILNLANLAKLHPVSVRFIEEMPFNGSGKPYNPNTWNHTKIHDRIAGHFANFHKIPVPESSTSVNYTFDGAQGNVGIIAAFSRTFCGTCDRVRITSTGEMRNCLYGHNVLNLKQLLRNGCGDDEIRTQIIDAVQQRARDGHEAEKLRGQLNPIGESMSVIGG